MVSMKIEQLIVKCGNKTINGISWRKIAYIEVLNMDGNEDYEFQWKEMPPEGCVEAFGQEDLMAKLFDKITFGKDTATIEFVPFYSDASMLFMRDVIGMKGSQKYGLVVRVK